MPLIRRRTPRPARIVPVEMPLEGSADARWATARALADSPDGVGALGDALRTETDPRVREAILTSLVRIGGRDSVGCVLPCLRSSLPEVRTAAMDALRAMIDDLRPSLPALLADPDADVRVLACDLVRELPSAEATRLVCELLRRETEVNVCATAVDVLAEVGEPVALGELRACAARFRDQPFLSYAIAAATQRLSAGGPAPDD